MFSLLIPATMISLVEKVSPKDLVIEYKPNTRKYYYIAGISWGLAILFSLSAFKYGEVTTIVPLQSTATLLNVLVAYAFLNEREDRLKKIISAGLVIIGIYLTVL